MATADAHSVKLDTYLQKVELGERRSAIGERQIARLYSRHQSSAAYILTREGAARYLELTASASSLPADYALFPNHPRRLGLAHLSARVPRSRFRIIFSSRTRAAKRFATAMAATDGQSRCGPFIDRLRSSDARAFVSPARSRA